MNDLRTAAQQALEALELVTDLTNHDDEIYEAITALKAALAQKHDPVAHSGWVLREVLFDNGEPIGHREPQHSPAALAQQAEPRNQCRSDGRCQYAIDHGAEGMGHCPKGKCVMAQHTQPAEDRDVAQSNLRVMKEMFREQAEPVEPVAWDVTKDGRLIYDYDFTHDVSLRVMGDFEGDEQRVRYAQRIVDKLNAAPPQRTMVPLTEEEIDAEWRELDGEVSTMFMRVLRKFARAVEQAAWEKNNGKA